MLSLNNILKKNFTFPLSISLNCPIWGWQVWYGITQYCSLLFPRTSTIISLNTRDRINELHWSNYYIHAPTTYITYIHDKTRTLLISMFSMVSMSCSSDENVGRWFASSSPTPSAVNRRHWRQTLAKHSNKLQLNVEKNILIHFRLIQLQHEKDSLSPWLLGTRAYMKFMVFMS